MRKFLITIFLFFASLSFADKAQDIIKKADEIRNPAESYEMLIEVKGEEDISEFQVFLKGQDRTIIVTKSPAQDKGRNMLMLDRDFHAYVPNLKRTVRLSLSQKLSGQVANGDISRTRWFGDYLAKIENESPKEFQLLLEGKKENLTYAAIRLWVEKSTGRPLRTEYLGLNGKTILKKAYFENYKVLAGAQRPSQIRIEDKANKTSVITIKAMEKKDFDDEFFTIRKIESLK
ncbi:MAG: outer membrane lipoprotein-sorting protein [Bdellovibrionaceae bacterium]|nr:outer membrane lipoprotein-sorting protein [Pseudobdellovibrionaceae bacterium]